MISSRTQLESLLDGQGPSATWLESEDARAMLGDVTRRRALYAFLHVHATQEHAPLVRALLHEEVAFRSDMPDEDPEDDYENLYRCALLLFEVGTLEDVIPLWRAKHIDMDTGCGLDIQCLLGSGLEATLAHLTRVDTEESTEVRAYILECAAHDGLEDLSVWHEGRRAYYGLPPRST